MALAVEFSIKEAAMYLNNSSLHRITHRTRLSAFHSYKLTKCSNTGPQKPNPLGAMVQHLLILCWQQVHRIELPRITRTFTFSSTVYEIFGRYSTVSTGNK